MRLLERIEELTLHNLPSFNTQNCANVLWGFAKLNYVPSALLPAISTQLAEVSFLAEMKPVEISDVAFAIALVGSREEHEPLMVRMLHACCMHAACLGMPVCMHACGRKPPHP